MKHKRENISVCVCVFFVSLSTRPTLTFSLFQQSFAPDKEDDAQYPLGQLWKLICPVYGAQHTNDEISTQQDESRALFTVTKAEREKTHTINNAE
jgi:hypothetical protein